MSRIVQLHIPNGGSCMGSQVVLEDGSKVSGIKQITLTGGVDQKVWGLHLEVYPQFIDQLPVDVELLSVGIAKDIEQIHADTVMIVVRGEFTRFGSLEDAQLFRGHLEELAKKSTKPIVFLDDSMSIEQFDDEQLKQIGLQRIKD